MGKEEGGEGKGEERQEQVSEGRRTSRENQRSWRQGPSKSQKFLVNLTFCAPRWAMGAAFGQFTPNLSRIPHISPCIYYISSLYIVSHYIYYISSYSIIFHHYIISHHYILYLIISGPGFYSPVKRPGPRPRAPGPGPEAPVKSPRGPGSPGPICQGYIHHPDMIQGQFGACMALRFLIIGQFLPQRPQGPVQRPSPRARSRRARPRSRAPGPQAQAPNRRKPAPGAHYSQSLPIPTSGNPLPERITAFYLSCFVFFCPF